MVKYGKMEYGGFVNRGRRERDGVDARDRWELVSGCRMQGGSTCGVTRWITGLLGYWVVGSFCLLRSFWKEWADLGRGEVR